MRPLFYLSKKYIKFLVMLSFTAIPTLSFSQKIKQGSLEYLQHCNGFKEITLGASAKLVPTDKLAFLDDDPNPDIDSCFKFEYKDENILKLGNGLFLDLVGIRIYKNQIVNIYLFFKKDDGCKVLKDFLANYGPATEKLRDFMYDWKTSAVTLALRYAPNIDLGVAIYTFNALENKLNLIRLKNNSTIAELTREPGRNDTQKTN